jgi:hypothetical protein
VTPEKFGRATITKLDCAVRSDIQPASPAGKGQGGGTVF